MNELRPTLWRTCRVLSDENRLRLLWRLMPGGEMSMTRLAESVGLSASSASKHLRALNSRGLIKAERRGLYLFYSAEANAGVDHAAELLEALRTCYSNAVSHSQIIRLATAFTHPRRIAIARALNGEGMPEAVLSVKTHISPESLFRHIKKLEKRGFIKKVGEIVYLVGHEMPFGQVLLDEALS